MKTSDQILAFLAHNKKMFRDEYHIVRIGLFGSYARGDQNINSDIDIIVEFEEYTRELYDLKLRLKEYFKKSLGSNVDICREKYIKPKFRSSILKETVYV